MAMTSRWRYPRERRNREIYKFKFLMNVLVEIFLIRGTGTVRNEGWCAVIAKEKKA